MHMIPPLLLLFMLFTMYVIQVHLFFLWPVPNFLMHALFRRMTMIMMHGV